MTGLPVMFPVRVQMLSDWIVGTGEGRVGDVDATVRRDSDGLPFVPAKTLTGIWRDACEQVGAWFGGPDAALAASWQAWVDWLFGSQPDLKGDQAAEAGRAPQPAALALSPARRPLPVRQACRSRPALQAAAVLRHPGVAVDDETGIARDDMLRVEERARPGMLEAVAEVTLPGGGELPPAAELLLRAGAAAVDGLGGKRNRGAGRCWMLLPGVPAATGDAPVPAAPRPADPRLAELAADTGLLDSPGPPPAVSRPMRRLAPVTGGAASNMPNGHGGVPGTGPERAVHRVVLETVTPLVAQHRVLGNVVLGRDTVPGSMLLPEILARVSIPVGHRDVVVGDARPAVQADSAAEPGLPVPAAWFRPKEQHRPDVVNAAHRRPDPEDRHKPMRSGHVAAAGDGGWYLLAPAMAVSTHAVIDDDAGRPTRDRGGVFTYLGIAPGTLLVSDVVLPAGAELRLAADDRLRLGRSRKDDFGQVEVREVRTVPAAGVTGIGAGAIARVWCVSDVLLRGPLGAPDPSPRGLADELTRQLGVPVSVVAQQAGGLVTQAHRAARRDSFHARWGRPRPTLVGLGAGSVITVSVAGPVPGNTLARVQRDGIGERTAEGFGQVRFDALEVAAAEPRLVSPPAPVPQADAALGESGGLPPAPDVIEQAAVQAEILRRVAAAVASGAERIVPGARAVSSRAQWGSLREQMPRLSTAAGRDAVTGWLEQTRAVRQRLAVWGEPALAALRRLVTDEQAVWEVLGLDGAHLDPFVLAPERAGVVRESLWAHAVTVLVTEISRDATRDLQAASTAEEARA